MSLMSMLDVGPGVCQWATLSAPWPHPSPMLLFALTQLSEEE